MADTLESIMFCRGGPWDRWGYFLADWERRVEAERGDPPRARWYKPTVVRTEDGREVHHKEPHPWSDSTKSGPLSEVWTWSPPEDWNDPYTRPGSPGWDKRADIIAAIGTLGRRGGQIRAIAAAMPYPCKAEQLAPLIFTLKQEGVIEASSTSMDPWYRVK